MASASARVAVKACSRRLVWHSQVSGSHQVRWGGGAVFLARCETKVAIRLRVHADAPHTRGGRAELHRRRHTGHCRQVCRARGVEARDQEGGHCEKDELRALERRAATSTPRGALTSSSARKKPFQRAMCRVKVDDFVQIRLQMQRCVPQTSYPRVLPVCFS